MALGAALKAGEDSAGNEPREAGRRPGASKRMDGKPPEATTVETPRVGDLERSLGDPAAEGRARCHPQVAEDAGAEDARRGPSLEVVVGGADGGNTYRATYLPYQTPKRLGKQNETKVLPKEASLC